MWNPEFGAVCVDKSNKEIYLLSQYANYLLRVNVDNCHCVDILCLNDFCEGDIVYNMSGTGKRLCGSFMERNMFFSFDIHNKSRLTYSIPKLNSRNSYIISLDLGEIIVDRNSCEFLLFDSKWALESKISLETLRNVEHLSIYGSYAVAYDFMKSSMAVIDMEAWTYKEIDYQYKWKTAYHNSCYIFALTEGSVCQYNLDGEFVREKIIGETYGIALKYISVTDKHVLIYNSDSIEYLIWNYEKDEISIKRFEDTECKYRELFASLNGVLLIKEYKDSVVTCYRFDEKTKKFIALETEMSNRAVDDEKQKRKLYYRNRLCNETRDNNLQSFVEMLT